MVQVVEHLFRLTKAWVLSPALYKPGTTMQVCKMEFKVILSYIVSLRPA